MFIIFYNHYLSKVSKVKNQVPQLKFKIQLLFGSLLLNPIREYASCFRRPKMYFYPITTTNQIMHLLKKH
jgi:hypothetical protein